MATEAQAKQLVDLIIYLAKDANVNTKPSYDDSIKLVTTILNTTSAVGVANPKVYSAFVTQQGNLHPTLLLRKDNIGIVIWTRVSEGTYHATKVGAFPENYTVPSNIPVVFKNKLNDSEVTARRISSDVIEITTTDVDGKLTDGLLTNFYIEFNVFV